MERYETLETLFRKVDLSFAEKALKEAFHPKDSAGSPPRSPIGVFKAHLLRRLRHIPSDRMLVRQLWKDPRLKAICDIEASQLPYGIAVLSRFRSRVGPQRLACITDDLIETLMKKGRIKGKTLALDSTFIKAYSRLHLAVDAKSELPVAMVVASANENEKKHSLMWFEKASIHVRPEYVVADPQYSSNSLREELLRNGAIPVIPYPRNQMKGVKGVLRVDKKFRSHGPQELRQAYKKRVAVERVFSRLKNLVDLKEHNLRGLAKLTFHSQLCVIAMLLLAQAAVNTHKNGKSRSIRYFAN